MIYQVDDKKIEVNIEDIQNNHMYIAMMTLDELKKIIIIFISLKELYYIVKKHLL